MSTSRRARRGCQGDARFRPLRRAGPSARARWGPAPGQQVRAGKQAWWCISAPSPAAAPNGRCGLDLRKFVVPVWVAVRRRKAGSVTASALPRKSRAQQTGIERGLLSSTQRSSFRNTETLPNRYRRPTAYRNRPRRRAAGTQSDACHNRKVAANRGDAVGQRQHQKFTVGIFEERHSSCASGGCRGASASRHPRGRKILRHIGGACRRVLPNLE